jgi:predicted O-methyltransferase YrrM
MEKEEYCILHEIARLPHIEQILELGPGAGCSTMTMLMALKEKNKGHLTAVDILPESALKVVTCRDRFSRFEGITNLFFEQNHKHRKMFDMVLVDACHRDAQSARDIENSLTFLNPNGIIVCHDLIHFDDNHVSQHTDIYRHVPRLGQAAGKRVKLIESIGHGLGIIY